MTLFPRRYSPLPKEIPTRPDLGSPALSHGTGHLPEDRDQVGIRALQNQLQELLKVQLSQVEIVHLAGVMWL